MNGYNYKETWTKKGKDFCIEVVRWSSKIPDSIKNIIDRGENHWNVYCYIYPEHKLFNESKIEDIFDCPVENMHGGCSYAQWHYNTKGELTSKQYGSDYAHYCDKEYSYMKTPEEAYQVFFDADLLYKELEEANK